MVPAMNAAESNVSSSALVRAVAVGLSGMDDAMAAIRQATEPFQRAMEATAEAWADATAPTVETLAAIGAAFSDYAKARATRLGAFLLLVRPSVRARVLALVAGAGGYPPGAGPKPADDTGPTAPAVLVLSAPTHAGPAVA
jgi:hypothetical protein